MNLAKFAERFSRYDVVLEPDRNTPEWWAGAPSVVRAPDGTFYLAARMREGNSPRGKRGYEVRILKSNDGIHFEPVHHITREAAGVPGFERPALVIDPTTGMFRLYGCAGLEGGWAILKWDDANAPERFDPASARPILRVTFPWVGSSSCSTARDRRGQSQAPSVERELDPTGRELDPTNEADFARVTGYKDPVVFLDRGMWHMFVIGCDNIERIHHFVSDDGEAWRPRPSPLMENTGWHNFFTRPASVIPMTFGYLFVYEGSHVTWRDPVYNIATGLAYTPDLETFIDLTPDAPILKSTTPGDYHTWRYSCWLPVDDKVYVYFEAARPNNTNEIRLIILDDII